MIGEELSLLKEQLQVLNAHVDNRAKYNTPNNYNKSADDVIKNSLKNVPSYYADNMINQHQSDINNEEWRSSHVILMRKKEGQSQAVLVKKAWE